MILLDDTFLKLAFVFQVKHFFCDFPLQGTYMLGKFKRVGWVRPLLAHASVHAAATFAIATIASSRPLFGLGCAAADLVVHFTVDRVKASPDLGGRWKPDSKYFWWALGADQAAHHLTHYAIIAAIMGVLR